MDRLVDPHPERAALIGEEALPDGECPPALELVEGAPCPEVLDRGLVEDVAAVGVAGQVTPFDDAGAEPGTREGAGGRSAGHSPANDCDIGFLMPLVLGHGYLSGHPSGEAHCLIRVAGTTCAP